MQIIEQFIQSRSGDPLRCEDLIVLSDDYLAVLDGATDEGGQEIDGLPSGLFAARTLAQVISEMPGDLGAEEALELLSQSLKGGQCDALIYSQNRKEVWRVGTVHLLFDKITYPPTRRIDEITSSARAAYNQALLLSGKNEAEIAKTDPGRELIMPLMRMQRFFTNDPYSEWGYGSINGKPIPPFFLEIFPAGSVTEIIFASDGYPEALPSLEESERVLAQKLENDPLCIKPPAATGGLRPGNSSFDDRAYLRFQP